MQQFMCTLIEHSFKHPIGILVSILTRYTIWQCDEMHAYTFTSQTTYCTITKLIMSCSSLCFSFIVCNKYF